MQRKKHPHHRENGNAFFIVMISVVLFAALMFTFSRGARQGGDNLTEKKAEIIATEILAYAQKVERAVNRIYGKGVSESAIVFDSGGSLCASGTTCPFAADGGLAGPPPQIENVTFTFWSEFDTGPASFDVDGIGSGNKDISMTAAVPQSVCIEINKKLGLAWNPIPSEEFSGDSVIDAFPGARDGCFYRPPGVGEYTYYHVLIER